MISSCMKQSRSAQSRPRRPSGEGVRQHRALCESGFQALGDCRTHFPFTPEWMFASSASSAAAVTESKSGPDFWGMLGWCQHKLIDRLGRAS